MNVKNNPVLKKNLNQKYLHQNKINSWEENIGDDYHSARNLMKLLFEQNILQDVTFQIEASHVTCTVNFEPKALKSPEYYLQDALLCQSRGSGKTEQAAFFQALAKIRPQGF